MAPSSSSAASSSALSRQGSSSGALAASAGSGRPVDPSRSPSVGSPSASAAVESIPVETLVELLLRAKRSLSSMTLVLRANELATEARTLHERAVVLAAQAAYLQRGIAQQLKVVERVRKGLARTYDSGRREFERLVKTLDAAGDRLTRTMNMLRATVVDAVFRPPGEEPRNLMHFVDENGVDKLTRALMDSIAELKAAETSFDGDLLRFDNDIRAVKKLLAGAPGHSSPAQSSAQTRTPIPHLVHSLTEQSHIMAENLASLTRHFDLCVTAVRSSEGGAALALRKAAEVGSSQQGDGADPVSISGVMGGGGSSESSSRASPLRAEEEPMEPHERVEMLRVVVQDAAEVDDVVADMHTGLRDMEADFAALQEQAELASRAHTSALEALAAVEEMGVRLASYVAAEKEYTDRCEAEKLVVRDRLEEVEALGHFYEGYAGAYDGLRLEYERRRAVEDKIQAVWRKALESVERLVESDRIARKSMQAEIGEYLPTDLWVGMNDPIRRWRVVPVVDSGEATAADAGAAVAGGNSGSGSGSPVVAPPPMDRSMAQPSSPNERVGRVR